MRSDCCVRRAEAGALSDLEPGPPHAGSSSPRRRLPTRAASIRLDPRPTPPRSTPDAARPPSPPPRPPPPPSGASGPRGRRIPRRRRPRQGLMREEHRLCSLRPRLPLHRGFLLGEHCAAEGDSYTGTPSCSPVLQRGEDKDWHQWVWTHWQILFLLSRAAKDLETVNSLLIHCLDELCGAKAVAPSGTAPEVIWQGETPVNQLVEVAGAPPAVKAGRKRASEVLAPQGESEDHQNEPKRHRAEEQHKEQGSIVP